MTRFVVIAGFIVAFAAGFAVQTRVHSRLPVPSTRPADREGLMAAELNLTPQQQEQLKRIWSDTAFKNRHDREERRRQLGRQRDDAIAKLIRPEDKARYDEALRKYADDSAALDREGRAAFQAADEQTRQILTPEQWPRYEELFLKRHEGQRDRHHGDRERGPGRRFDGRGTSTQPASQP